MFMITTVITIINIIIIIIMITIMIIITANHHGGSWLFSRYWQDRGSEATCCVKRRPPEAEDAQTGRSCGQGKERDSKG
jgi:hypothetical protein